VLLTAEAGRRKVSLKIFTSENKRNERRRRDILPDLTDINKMLTSY
jgi:hypothetical protein